MSEATRKEVCICACADLFASTGEVLVSPFGTIPMLGARLAKLTSNPDIALTDGEAALLADVPSMGEGGGDQVRKEAPLTYRSVFDVVWSGRRHVMMMASQIDREGNQNIAAIGDWSRPRTQLVGVRGAPGNSVNHATSYWVPDHSKRSFVEHVDCVCGVGVNRAQQGGIGASRYHSTKAVVSNLGVFDISGPRMGIVSLHPGVTIEEVKQATGFDFGLGQGADPNKEDSNETGQKTTRIPSKEELRLIRQVLDPQGLRESG